MTRPARAAFAARFEREVDPGGVLEPAERRRRAEAAMRSHMLRLAARSAAARVVHQHREASTAGAEEDQAG
ncbi:MAG: hypothetical protein WCK58_04915 [Chloroflexota bacterium]